MKAIAWAVLAATVTNGAWAAPARKAPAKATAKAAARAPEPTPSVLYDFKGARLGMTFAEFQAMPAPTNPVDSWSSAKNQPERIICSGDTYPNGKPVDTVYVSKTEAALGIKSCKYARAYKLSFGDYWNTESSGINIGSWEVRDVTYDFLDGRLAKIEINSNKNLFSDVVDGLTAKFGPPTKRVDDTTQNKAGATFPHTELYWINPAATIYVETPFTKIDNMYVSYKTADYLARVNAKEQELNPSASKM